MRGWRGLLCLAAAAMVTPGWAQTTGTGPELSVPHVQSPILTINPDRLYANSAFGKAALQRQQAAEAALAAENQRIDAALAAEEEALTARRATLPVDEFRVLAADFDTKVERMRSDQDAKFRLLTERRDADRKRFLDIAVPVLGRLMGELGAVAIVDKNTIFLAFDRIDVTDTAIARIDAELGDGTQPDVGDTPETVPVQP
jgi:Skp family chaperone for outer membrane proteins